MSKKKILYIIIFVVGLFSIYFIYNKVPVKETVLDEVKLKEEIENKSSSFALMLEQEDGTYKESDSSTWPTDMVFNSEKSGCVDATGKTIENVLSYNASTNSVKVKVTGATYCYIYFDLPIPSVKLTVSTDGASNTLPTYNHYKQTLTCDDGTTSSFNVKYQRLEISNVGKTNTNCNLNYTSDTNTYTLLSDKVKSVGTEITSTNNAGGTDTSYRYTGKTPNNYVWFNNEMWRIIGLIPVCTKSGCGTPDTSLVKIIRNESIGGIAYDAKSSGYTGAWGSNTLYTLLNSYYLGKGNGTGTSYCYGYYTSSYKPVPNCNYGKIGVSSSATDYYGRMVENVYWNTGASAYNATAPAVYTTETKAQTVSGKIGLMSASDYGYAGTDYTNSMSSSTFANNTKTNWLYGQSYEWTSIQDSSYSNYALDVYYSGYVYSSDAYSGSAVRPVLYLDSNVYIINGDGTESSPYILGM